MCQALFLRLSSVPFVDEYGSGPNDSKQNHVVNILGADSDVQSISRFKIPAIPLEGTIR